jgi:protein TonB
MALALSACAQQEAPRLPVASTPKPAPEKVYTFVEQMPQLPGGCGTQRIWNEFQKRLRFPAIDLRQQYNGSATVYLEISPSGVVQHVKLLRFTGSAAMDSALTTAAKALPRFTPGYQNGRPVTVSITLPIACLKPQ